jgi:hypothetical protein
MSASSSGEAWSRRTNSLPSIGLRVLNEVEAMVVQMISK